MFSSSPLVALTLASVALAQTYTATYTPGNAPDKSEGGQSGTNKCGGGNNQSSMCQNVYVNSLDDWCIFAPPQPNGVIGETERIEVAWCIQGGYGTRVIPDGAISGAHFVQTPDYVQVTGVGDLTKINIAAGDEGGELDPHGADGKGNPIGGLVFSDAFGSMKQMHEWTNFVSANEFCIRACKDGPKAPQYCQHIYDVMGCYWNMPGDYSNSFDSCHGDSGEPMGVYGTSTFHQGQPSTPPAHPVPPKSQCANANTIANGIHVTTPNSPAVTTTSTTAALSTTSTPATTSAALVVLSTSTTSSVSSGSTSTAKPTSSTGTTTGGSATTSGATSAPAVSTLPVLKVTENLSFALRSFSGP
ncbi:hypothetical protein C8Q80DRAFT_1296968 [Daedaleopsis nitida]|nr:hypothetical protein C8Q80DRAFT_1296968 [Daedaleopsis nitida]